MLGLTGRGQHGAPPAAFRIELLSAAAQQLDGNVDEPLVQKSDYQPGLARHGGVHRVAREEIAEQRILAVGGAAAHLVARIKIAQHDGDLLRSEKIAIRSHKYRPMSFSLIFPEASRSDSPASKSCPAPSATAMTACDFVCMRAFNAARNESILKGTSRDQSKFTSWLATVAPAVETRMPAHELHHPDASLHAARLRVRAIQHARRLLHRGKETEGAGCERDVVVDGLRHAHHRQRVAAAAGLLVEIVGAALRPVASDGEQDVDASRDQILNGAAGVDRAARVPRIVPPSL